MTVCRFNIQHLSDNCVISETESLYGNDVSDQKRTTGFLITLFNESSVGHMLCRGLDLNYDWIVKMYYVILFTNVKNACLFVYMRNTKQMSVLLTFTCICSLFCFAEGWWKRTLTVHWLEKSSGEELGVVVEVVFSLFVSLSACTGETCCSVSVRQRS